MAAQSRPPLSSAEGTAPCLLLTRPHLQSQRFAESLAGLLPEGTRIVISPLLAPCHLVPALPGDAGAVIFTSAEAVAACHAGNLLPMLPKPAYCVGLRTAEAAREAGFAAISAEGDAEALVALILARHPKGLLLHLHGEDTRGDVADRLATAGLKTAARVVYRQDPLPLSPEAREALSRPGRVIAPVFSPRTARLLAEALLAPAPVARVDVAAISAAAAQPLAEQANGRHIVARRPDAGAMREAVLDLAGITRRGDTAP